MPRAHYVLGLLFVGAGMVAAFWLWQYILPKLPKKV